MHIGLSRPPTPPHPATDIDGAAVAIAAEEAGFESLFYGEHPISPAGGEGHSVHSAGVPYFQDTLVMLARASAVTRRIRLGSAVFLIPAHHPVLFAKQLASLDAYSGGRIIVGAGVGWSRIECEATGGNFDRHWGQAREAIQLMKRLWSDDVAEFHGEFFDVPPVRLYPKPARAGGPPVLLPGPPFDAAEPMDSPRLLAAFRRIAAYADGWLPGIVGLESMARGPQMIVEGRKVLARLCEEAGRDPRTLQVTALLRTEVHDGDPAWPELVSRDVLRRYEDVGVERAVITIPTVLSESHAREVVMRVAEAVL
jgi:probable F420-dependent oxidoreductase